MCYDIFRIIQVLYPERIANYEILSMTRRLNDASDWYAYLLWLLIAWAIGLGSLAINVLLAR